MVSALNSVDVPPPSIDKAQISQQMLKNDIKMEFNVKKKIYSDEGVYASVYVRARKRDNQLSQPWWERGEF